MSCTSYLCPVQPESRSQVLKDDDYFLNKYSGQKIEYKSEKGKYPPMLYDFLEVLDFFNSGVISVESIDDAADMIRSAMQAKHNNSAELKYKHMPEAVRRVLATWDADNNGSVAVSELILAAEAQNKMRNENRLLKKIIVGAIIVILILMAGTFVLSLTAAEMAKDTNVKPDSGIIMTKSGKQAAMASAVDHVSLVDFPSLGLEKLKQIRDFSFTHNGIYYHSLLAEFRVHSESKLELVSNTGSVITIESGAMTLQTPDGRVEMLDPSAGRRLAFVPPGSKLPPSGSFTLTSGLKLAVDGPSNPPSRAR